MYAHIKANSKINVVVDGKPYTVGSDHFHYEDIVKLLDSGKQGIEAELVKLIDMKEAINVYGEGKITVREGKLYNGDRELHGSLVERILDLLRAKKPVEYLCKFLENLYENPSMSAVDETFLFLETNELPITDDGHFLAYKAIDKDYKDKYSHTFDNSVGAVVSMPRNDVDDERSVTCSTGLHVARFGYAKDFAYGTDRMVMVKVNPADVVSVPYDYGNAKMRCCKYEVVSEIDIDRLEEVKEKVEATPAISLAELWAVCARLG